MDIDSAREEFLKIRHKLIVLESSVRAEIIAVIRDERIANAIVSGRVKTVGSFCAKVVDKGSEYQPDPLARMTDKVGIRVEVLHSDDVEKICRRIRSKEIGDVLKEDNKRHDLGVDNIGYQGVHFDIVPRDVVDIRNDWQCVELQVRTRSQGVWAMANHEISYKSPIDVPDNLRRRLVRMTVFMETFDEEVKRVRDEVMSDQEYPMAKLIDELHGQRARIGRSLVESSSSLTRRMINQLLGDEKCPLNVASSIEEWMSDNVGRVSKVIEEYDDVGRQFFVDRPEGLLAFYLISTDKYELAERWHKSGYDKKILEDLFLAWGEVVPSSEPW